MFYLDRKVKGVFIPVLDPETRKLKLFKCKGDTLAYAVWQMEAMHRCDRVTICRS